MDNSFIVCAALIVVQMQKGDWHEREYEDR